jgi:F-type H+-transporting ATPase subunit b
MTAAPVTHTGTEAQHGAGFPPFKTESFPSQFFWLVVCFTVLFVVLWRIAGPRIAGVIGQRKGQISGDIAAADKHKNDAKAALTGYETALANARAKAHAEADENRRKIEAEVDKAKAAADAVAKESAAKAEAEIAAARDEAAKHVTKVAQDAAADIVNRLIGDTVSPEEAEAAVRATGS